MMMQPPLPDDVAAPPRLPACLPFFLPAYGGQRLCLYHAPPEGVTPHAAVLYAHPFGDEMNRTRRMAALQARAFASAGIAVLQIDLYGCGDSSGDFADARWEIWKDDLALAHAWLSNAANLVVDLWGTRLGALLALDYARDAARASRHLILWQPVISGETHLTQFLRLRLANEMLSGDSTGNPDPAGNSTRSLRERLRSGQPLEVAGYELAPALAAAIDRADASRLAPVGGKVAWLDVLPDASRPPPPASQRIVADWQRAGASVTLQAVPGPAFWSTQEITECPALLTATTGILTASTS